MRIRWYGQSAFLVGGAEGTVMIDPFADPGPLRARGMRFDYPTITGVSADVVLVTHEHVDHNAVGVVEGDPSVVRLAGQHDTPIGPVVGVASEHDDAAGSQRGPNAIYRFSLDGLTLCHMGDFGQDGLRDAQKAALGTVDVLFVPAGGGPTIGGEQAAAAARELGARWVVPMHYRTPAVDFLGPLDPFLAAFDGEVREASEEVELDPQERPRSPQALILAAPTGG
jgi:L-ascorbate metabolism protein UlaG (beta-lactamase superfamily)